MQESHLLPGEIDLLLDGDEGFAVFPLRKHVAGCAQCRAELGRARALIDDLERLPHAGPSLGFANRVMAKVEVFEPWYVTVIDSVRRSIPRSGPWRVLAGAGAGGVALSLSALAVWVSFRMDFAVYAAQLGWHRTQTAIATSAGMAVSQTFGDSALSALRNGGMPMIALLVTGLVVVLAGATIGLRRLIGASGGRRS